MNPHLSYKQNLFNSILILIQNVVYFIFRTALHWAAKRGHKSIVTLLLQHGANTQALNIKGETPAFVAKNSEIRALLGESDTTTPTTSPTSSLPITPSYLKHPPLNSNSSLNSVPPSVEINGWQNKRQAISMTNITTSTNVAHLNYDPNEGNPLSSVLL